MNIGIKPKNCLIYITKQRRRIISLHIKKQAARRTRPAIVLKQRHRTVPTISLVNQSHSVPSTQRRSRQLSARSLQIIAERNARLERIRERPRLVPVIRMPTLNITSFMRLFLQYLQRNEHSLLFPDHDDIRNRIELALRD
ncbi:hypothetical protein ACHWQZ_G013148 [Mnemiopsis leidyi]